MSNIENTIPTEWQRMNKIQSMPNGNGVGFKLSAEQGNGVQLRTNSPLWLKKCERKSAVWYSVPISSVSKGCRSVQDERRRKLALENRYLELSRCHTGSTIPGHLFRQTQLSALLKPDLCPLKDVLVFLISFEISHVP